MLKDWLPLEEQHALEAICRHHNITDPEAIKHLAQLGNWIHAAEQAKINRSQLPPFLISVLGAMGIYRHKPQPPKEPQG